MSDMQIRQNFRQKNLIRKPAKGAVQMKAVVDRIEGDTAVLLIGEEEQGLISH